VGTATKGTLVEKITKGVRQVDVLTVRGVTVNQAGRMRRVRPVM